MVSVGEIVNGGPLPPVPRHTPVCSFNSQNKFVGESLAAELSVGTQRPGLDAAGEWSCSCTRELAACPSRKPLGSQKYLSCFGAQMWMLFSAQVFHPDVGLIDSWHHVLASHREAQGGWPVLTSLWVAWRLFVVPTCACSLPGVGRGEECGTEADASPPTLLLQPLPILAPALPYLPHHPAATPSAAPGLFQPAMLPPMQPELLPAKPEPVYSEAVRSLPAQAPSSLLRTTPSSI